MQNLIAFLKIVVSGLYDQYLRSYGQIHGSIPLKMVKKRIFSLFYSPEWFMSASAKIKVIAKNMTKVALIAEEASKYLAKAYNLSKDEVTFGLPLSDVRGTRLSTLCQIKVDFPCQPGKYRAYNGYCNNVQNPNWGVANRRFLR